MSLTADEQAVFNRMLDGDYLDEPDDAVFLRKFADRIFELTDNVMLKMRIDNIVRDL